MNTFFRFALSSALCALIVAPTVATAGGGGSGSKSKVNVRVKNLTTTTTNTALVGIETVEVGDPGNYPAVINGQSAGFVGTTFRMAKYEVTIGDYVTFLNAVATRGDGANATVVASLYDSRMATDTNVAGIARSGSGTEASPYAYSAIGDPKKPVAYVDFFSAARFANWMHNGATATADIESGAYNLAGGFSQYVHRESGAKWWVPSQDEWFKAAYFKGGPVDAGYWMFPTRSDTIPANGDGAGMNAANFLLNAVYAVTGATSLDPAQNYLTSVGTFVNSPGPYGTFDQGGNVEEWTDDVPYIMTSGASRVTRGGAWNSGGLNYDVDPIPTALPSDRSGKIGFRLARLATDSSTPSTTSRVFVVSANSGQNSVASGGRGLNPGQVTQFKVNKGAFTVNASDPESPSATQMTTFNTGSRKTVYIGVSLDGSTIVLTDTTDRF
jgi:sulfatase modifying factor 1